MASKIFTTKSPINLAQKGSYPPPSLCDIALQICSCNNTSVAPLTLSVSLFSTASPASATSLVGTIENHRAFHLSSPPWLFICWLNCAPLYLSQPLPLLRTDALPCSSVLHYSSNHCPLSPVKLGSLVTGFIFRRKQFLGIIKNWREPCGKNCNTDDEKHAAGRWKSCVSEKHHTCKRNIPKAAASHQGLLGSLQY
ncbi:hypothetical protein PIB30_029543 [Stylosanthes scabra]|uniref:Uncharacterized protein n=1 Tax=Stylosanthes scabra TaxID=79078 RepID=A0ABU6VDE8_9FABA|nr:hypothetical protein [Stylosanthes scabra]